MANLQSERTAERNDVAGRIVRICILIIVSFVVAIAAVSFAVHHMRLQFEDEFKKISDTKMRQVTDVVRMTVDGDDLVSPTVNAPAKYSALLDLMLADTSTENLSAEGYGLFGYNQGQLSLLVSRGVNDPSEFAVAGRDISEWLGSSEATILTGENYESIIVPVTDSTGMCVGVFEYKCTFGELYAIGDKLEARILTAVVIAVLAGVLLFAAQEILIRVIRNRQNGSGGKKSTETAQSRDRRLISSTIGYCFTIILVVLLVMATQLSKTYIKALESERADMMERCAVTSAAALTYSEVRENMNYMLPIYKYAPDKPYQVNIYTMAGDSFLRLYSSTATGNVQQYYLTGAGNQYVDCFGLQQSAFTARNEAGTSYVCAIAPIISSSNTVAGVLEIMMPRSDFESSVNGMSLSWIFTIISIAISMGIMIFELNLLISTISKGISGNSPVLVMYGENANRFLSFFTAFGSIMLPVAFADYFKEQLLSDLPSVAVQGIICAAMLLFIWGFLGFSGLRNSFKMKLTSRIALIAVTCAGYFFALIAGVINIPYVTAVLALPIGFCFGMSFDYLRDYRINAGRLGYKDYNDRVIHNVQASSYFLGVAVGAVIAGICYERYGLFVVTIISGAALVLTSIGMIYFMQNNTQVREAPLTVSSYLSVFSNSRVARFLNSSFLMLGVVLAFVLMFIPNYLENVGISLPTTSFYYLVCGFTACFVCGFVKNRYAHLLTSRTRVLIQAASTVIGLFIFALMPSAKTLVITCAFLGIALGIHDYYYIYVLYLICNGKVKVNLRKLAEFTVYLGAGLMLPIIMAAFMLKNYRITFLILTLIVAILAFAYPMSSFSGKIDERDISLKPQKKQREKPAPKAPQTPRPAPQVQGQPSAPEAVADDNRFVQPEPQIEGVIPEQQYEPQAPVQQYQQPAQSQDYQQYQQYQQPAQQQYQADSYQYDARYQQPVQNNYQADPYAYGAQQYQQPVQPGYQQDPYQSQYVQNPADPYAGGEPVPYDMPPQQGGYDPLGFLNGEGNEGGNQNG